MKMRWRKSRRSLWRIVWWGFRRSTTRSRFRVGFHSRRFLGFLLWMKTRWRSRFWVMRGRRGSAELWGIEARRLIVRWWRRRLRGRLRRWRLRRLFLTKRDEHGEIFSICLRKPQWSGRFFMIVRSLRDHNRMKSDHTLSLKADFHTLKWKSSFKKKPED